MGPVIFEKFRDLFYIGIDRSAYLYEIRHVLLTNIMVVILSFYALFMGLLFYNVAPFIGRMAFGYFILVWFASLLHYYKHYLPGRIYFVGISWMLMTGMAIGAGRESNMHLYLLFSLVLAFFIFTRKEKVYMILTVLLMLFSYTAVEFSYYPEPFQIITAQEALALSNFVKGGIIPYVLFFGFFIFFIINNTEKSLVAEQDLSERLLHNILPSAIAKKLKTDPGMVAEKSESGTVLFADIVGFTALTAAKTPEESVRMLNDIFSEFDDLIEVAGLEKIKTIGDAVMVAGGIPEYHEDHLKRTAGLALAMQQTVREKFSKKYGIDLRIGIDTGEIVAGIIGRKKFLYDLWGHTVNTASRMESNGVAGKIQVTERVYEKLNSDFLFECRGNISCKGMGEVNTYFLNGHREQGRDQA